MKDVAHDFKILKTQGRGGFDEIDKIFSKKVCKFLSIDSDEKS